MVHQRHLVHFTTSLGVGGAESVLYSLITHLDPARFKHAVVYIHGGPYVEKLRAHGIALHQVHGVVSTYDPLFFMRLYYLLKKLKPDCLHTLLWSANCAGRVVAHWLNIPCVSVCHNNIDQNGAIRTMIDRCTGVNTASMVAVSDEVANSMQQAYNVIRTKITVIPNGIDDVYVRQQATKNQVSRAALNLTSTDFVIGSVGRFVPVKNYPMLIDVCADLAQEYPNLRLVLVGIGPEEKALRAYAQKRGIADKVRFVVGQSAYGYYPLFDLFVLTSKQEGISIALLEAMSCGVVPVVTNLYQTHPVIKSGHNGYVVPSGNKAALCDQLQVLISSNGIKASRGVDIQTSIRNYFSLSVMISAYECYFEKSFL